MTSPDLYASNKQRPVSRLSSLFSPSKTNREADAQQQLANLISVGALEAPSRSKSLRRKDSDKSARTDSRLSKGKGKERAIQSEAPDSERRPGTPKFLPQYESTPGSSRLATPNTASETMPGQVTPIARERTFVGNNCATCEEPLEHTLRGERILQLTCGHVSHEACLYEYIREFAAQTCPTCDAPLVLDAKRSGNVNLGAINKFTEPSRGSVASHDRVSQLRFGNSTSWDAPSMPQISENMVEDTVQHRSADRPRYSYDNRDRTTSRMSSVRSHNRHDSADTGRASTNYHSENATTQYHRHEFDAQSIDTSNSSARQVSWNPIPAPLITIRSEFPTIIKSRQQQTLTCLVTVEVTDGKWIPIAENTTPEKPLQSNDGSVHSLTPKGSRDKRPLLSVRQESTTTIGTIRNRAVDSVHEQEPHEHVKNELHGRVDNWHGLDFARFGKLLKHGPIRVAKDGQTWQMLECYLFQEMLICIKEKKTGPDESGKSRSTLKGSILIKRHLTGIETTAATNTLTLTLSVAELPHFHLQYADKKQLESWRRVLMGIHQNHDKAPSADEQELSTTDEDDHQYESRLLQRTRSHQSSPKGHIPSQASLTNGSIESGRQQGAILNRFQHIHVPIDLVVVVPVSSSMQGLKIELLRDTLLFLVKSLGERDRMGLVTFGSSSGSVPLVGMTNKSWNGWTRVIESVRPLGQKNMRTDVVEGANVAVDLLMQRRSSNPLSSIFLISDATTSEHESTDFVVSRAEAAKISVYTFGLGMTHRPDSMVELSTRTKGSYTYVKDWMLLRECLAGSMGAMQSSSHQNVKLKLRLPEGSPAKFVKISGALQITKRATGRDAEVTLGDLRFGDKRDVLVQLSIPPDLSTPSIVPVDAWDNVIAGLEALGGAPSERGDSRPVSIEELPLLQANISWNNLLHAGSLTQLPQPGLLTISVLPPRPKADSLPPTPPIPPHPSIVQRRMELLTSDMLSRALTLVGRGQHDRASHLLAETRSILKGLGKGGLPPLPPPPSAALPPTPSLPATPRMPDTPVSSPPLTTDNGTFVATLPERKHAPTPPQQEARTTVSFNWASNIDQEVMQALDAELAASCEWMAHPAVFSRDSRKAVLQAIGTISTQRGYTFRTPIESLWASRTSGIKRLIDLSRAWKDTSEHSLIEEA